ncbi:hypothetical protein OK016_13300 [Vibrio chagasii]|nr:hypothetical protein [Vibrio chagasii]
MLPSRVPDHETAYALTIPQIAGQWVITTLMILPPDFSGPLGARAYIHRYYACEETTDDVQ